MKYAIYSPPFGSFSDPRILAELAREAEAAGWDGYFIWDHIQFGPTAEMPPAPIADPWVTLAAMAVATARLRLGTVVTPLPRRRPWKLAREAVTLDYLSNGRLTLGLGIGSDQFGREYSAFGEPCGDRTHAEMLDEGLDVLSGLWTGEQFSYSGKHYRLDEVQFQPRPLQTPRIPIWLAGWWPHRNPLRRAARWDGLAPCAVGGALTPADYRAVSACVAQYRTSAAPFDLIRLAPLPVGGPGVATAEIKEFEDAGVTWWLAPLEDDMGPHEELLARIRLGPPSS